MQYSNFKINLKHSLYKNKFKISPLIFIVVTSLLITTIFSLKILLTKPDYKYYISVNGSDANNGSKDYPLQSIQGFKDLLIKDIKDNKINNGSINVYIENGTYNFSEGFKLSNNDLSDKDISISFIGENKNKVYFTGGVTLDNKKLKPLNNNIFNLFKDKIYYYDLSKENIDFNFKDDAIEKAPEIFSKNTALTLARYPNEGFILTNTIISNKDFKGKGQYVFNINDKLSKDFNYDTAYVNGYWYHDWSDSTAKIEKVKDNKLTINGNLSYGIKENQRFYIFNVLEALDNENEYYIDYDKKLIYLIPEDNNKNSEIKLSLLSEPLIQLKDISNITFKNIIFENTRSNGISIDNSKNITIKNCIIRNLSMCGISLNNVSNSNITKNKIYNTGTGGIYANGGDRITLTSSNIKINQNEIYNFSRIKKTYSAAINMKGVGITATDNKIYDAPHTGILFSGNDHIIEENEIFDICKETNDVGAIYSGRDWTYRGNIIKKNYIHDLNNKGLGNLVIGIYLDDCFSSAHVYKNKIENVPLAILAGGGRDNIIEKNLINNCTKSISFDDRGLSGSNYDTLNSRLNDVPYNSKTWIKKYPEIKSLDTTDPRIPYGNSSVNNKLKNTSEIIIKDTVKEYGNVQ